MSAKQIERSCKCEERADVPGVDEQEISGLLYSVFRKNSFDVCETLAQIAEALYNKDIGGGSHGL